MCETRVVLFLHCSLNGVVFLVNGGLRAALPSLGGHTSSRLNPNLSSSKPSARWEIQCEVKITRPGAGITRLGGTRVEDAGVRFDAEIARFDVGSSS